MAVHGVTEHQNVQDPTQYDGREFEAAAKLDNYYTWITEKFRPFLHGYGVEIGAGVGNYSKYLRPHFHNLDLVEPSIRQGEALGIEFAGDANVHTHASDIETYISNVEPSSRDAVCMVNVLEHIEDEGAALNTLRGALVEGGHICIFVPALSFLYSKLDRIFGHYRRYSKAELARVVEDAGFEIIKLEYMDFAGIFAWGLINTLGGSTNLNPRATKIYDRFIIPVTRIVENIVPIPLGKSLVLVARRPL